MEELIHRGDKKWGVGLRKGSEKKSARVKGKIKEGLWEQNSALVVMQPIRSWAIGTSSEDQKAISKKGAG